METHISNIIEESLFNEVKRTIIKENKDSKEIYHITCEGQPVDSFETKEIAMRHLDIYKKNHPEKEFIIEKIKYNSPSEMIDKLDEMSEDFKEKKENKKMKKVTVSGLPEALMNAKEKGLKEIKYNGKVHDVDECWKQLEEEESMCDECGQGYMEEDLVGNQTKIDVNKNGKIDSDDFKKLRAKKDTKEEKMDTCSECGGMMNEEGMCNECGMKNMYESTKKSIRLTESELVSLISKMVMESKKKMNETVPGLMVTKKAQSGSKRESDEYMKDVEKKLKDASSFNGNDNPEFPKQVGKGEKVAFKPTDKQEDEIADNRGGTMIDLDYDFEPSENFKKRLKMALEGDPKMGNSQDAANVIKSKTGENLYKSSERKKEKQEKGKEVFWGARGVQPLDVKTVNESKKPSMTSILNEEIQKMKKIIGYDETTQ